MDGGDERNWIREEEGDGVSWWIGRAVRRIVEMIGMEDGCVYSRWKGVKVRETVVMAHLSYESTPVIVYCPPRWWIGGAVKKTVGRTGVENGWVCSKWTRVKGVA